MSILLVEGKGAARGLVHALGHNDPRREFSRFAGLVVGDVSPVFAVLAPSVPLVPLLDEIPLADLDVSVGRLAVFLLELRILQDQLRELQHRLDQDGVADMVVIPEPIVRRADPALVTVGPDSHLPHAPVVILHARIQPGRIVRCLVTLDERAQVVRRVPAEILARPLAFGLGVADGVVVHRLGRGHGDVRLRCQRQVDDPQDGRQGQACDSEGR